METRLLGFSPFASLSVAVQCRSATLTTFSPSVSGMKGRDMLRSNAMTIGQLSRRTGVPIKVLRIYEDLGFLYSLGRSGSTYRLFGEETMRCVQVIQGLRSLGLTLKEIQAARASPPAQMPTEPAVSELAQLLARDPCWGAVSSAS